MNFFNVLLGNAAPIAANCIVTLTASFCGRLPLAAVVLLFGIFAYLVLLGEITSLPDLEPSLAHETAGGH